jgi:L-2-hydroxyglutarate oxidase LhgO
VSSKEPKSDVLIIGAGIVGLSVGIALLEARPSLKILIIDKESGPGQHASGRNSGVLHAGFSIPLIRLKQNSVVKAMLNLEKSVSKMRYQFLSVAR